MNEETLKRFIIALKKEQANAEEAARKATSDIDRCIEESRANTASRVLVWLNLNGINTMVRLNGINTEEQDEQ